MEKLKDEWKSTLRLLAGPWNVFLLLVAAVLYFFTIYAKPEVVALLTALLGVLTSVVGANLGARWMELQQRAPLSARGTSAVRSLKLLLGKITQLESRVSEHEHAANSNKDTLCTTVPIYFGEIRATCASLQADAVSAIENWTDLVPEANIAGPLEALTALRDQVEAKAREVVALSEELAHAKALSTATAGQLEELQKRIREKEGELLTTRQEMERQRAQAGLTFSTSGNTASLSMLPSLPPSAKAFPPSVLLNWKCSRCGKPAQKVTLSGGEVLCPECREHHEGDPHRSA